MAIQRKQVEAGFVDFSGIIDPSVPRLAPVSPGELLRDEWLKPLGISAYRLAKDIGVPPNRVSAILAGSRVIQPIRRCAWRGTLEPTRSPG